MEQDNVISVLDSLANGVDPVTGEVFPMNSPYNHPEVIRALFHALKLMPKEKKAKKSLEEKQQENLSQGRPMNYGLPWLDTDVNWAVQVFQQGMAIDAIAQQLARKPSSIISLLKKQGIISEEQALALGAA